MPGICISTHAVFRYSRLSAVEDTASRLLSTTSLRSALSVLKCEVRQFGIRVTLVEPTFTRTNLDVNSPHAKSKIAAYERERSLASHAVADSVSGAPDPDGVASTIVEAALGAWQMRRTPAGQASLLSKLRRFMPAGPVDTSLRKSFGLS